MRRKRIKDSKSRGSRAKRKYDGSSRKEKVKEVRLNVIKTFVELLAERKGGEVLLDEVASRANVSVRTVYRLFEDRTALFAATDEYTQRFIVSAAGKLELASLHDYVCDLFKLFELYESLTLAYLHSSFGKESRAAFRKKYNQLITAKIINENKLSVDEAMKPKLAFIVTLINARIWEDMRNDFGLDGKVTGELVAQAIELLVKAL